MMTPRKPERDLLTIDMTALSEELTDDCVNLITTRCREAGYTRDVLTVPIIAGVALNILQRIAEASVKHHGLQLKRKIGWLAMKRIKRDLLND